jgi:hypothetical protein
VDRADSDGGQHRDDRLGGCGHVDREAITPADPEPAEAGRYALNFVKELAVGQRPAAAPLVERDQRRRVATAGIDVSVEGVR